MIDVSQFPSGGLWVPAREYGSQFLLVGLHGSNGSSHNFEGFDEILNIPNLNYLYLNGPIRSYSNYMWYDSIQSRQEAYQYLNNAFDKIRQQGYSAEHIFLLGFSQGAALTFEFGARYPHLLAGYIAMSGRIEDLPGLLNEGNPKIIRNGKWLVTHGARDYNLSVDIIRQQAEQLRQAGFKIDYQEYDKIHEFDSELELPYIRNWILQHM